MPVREDRAFGGETAAALRVRVRGPEPLDTSSAPGQLDASFHGEPDHSCFKMVSPLPAQTFLQTNLSFAKSAEHPLPSPLCICSFLAPSKQEQTLSGAGATAQPCQRLSSVIRGSGRECERP